MLAIATHFVGMTDKRDRRVVAAVMERKHDGEPVRRVTHYWNDRLGVEGNHKAAFVKLVKKLGWTSPHYSPWHMGGTDPGYVFVLETGVEGDKISVEADPIDRGEA